MAITINTNTASNNTQRRINETTGALSKTFQRLSSGLRIVSAADDAAGLAIADGLRADQRLAGMAVRNANDGVSMINITDSALNEIGNVLTRMAELAEQSANGVLSTSQRSALQGEFVALGSEIQRIAEVTEFNGIALLSGGAEVSFQIGLNAKANAQIAYSGVQGTLTSLGLAAQNSAVLTNALNGNTTALAQTASRSALDNVKLAISSLSTTRGSLGAIESRLGSTIANLQVSRENFAAAESRIRDVDVAMEAANLTKLNILQQAGASILSQANQQPGLALSLLR
jgi:flagellin